MRSHRDLGKSQHHVSAASADLRGRDAVRAGDDDRRQGQWRPRERRAVADRGPAVQERPVGGQAARRPGTRTADGCGPVAPTTVRGRQARVAGLVVGRRLQREHPEGDIETVAAQPVPAGAQQGVQRAEQHGQRGLGGRVARSPPPPRAPPPLPAAPPVPPAPAAAPAEHGQVAVGERDRAVADIAGGVERVAAEQQAAVVPAVPHAPRPHVRAQLRRGPHAGRGHQARVPGGRGGAQPARRDRPRLRGRAHALPPERARGRRRRSVVQQDAQPAQLPDDQLRVRAVRQPVQHARGAGRHHFRLREHRDGAPVAQRGRAHVLLQPQLHGGRHTERHLERYVRVARAV